MPISDNFGLFTGCCPHAGQKNKSVIGGFIDNYSSTASIRKKQKASERKLAAENQSCESRSFSSWTREDDSFSLFNHSELLQAAVCVLGLCSSAPLCVWVALCQPVALAVNLHVQLLGRRPSSQGSCTCKTHRAPPKLPESCHSRSPLLHRHVSSRLFSSSRRRPHSLTASQLLISPSGG